MDSAQASAGYGGTIRARADKEAILGNLQRLRDWKCLSAENIEEMKKGGSPITAKGEAVALDHVLPVSIVPELAARFYNLEVILATEYHAKGAKVAKREMDFARKLHALGLLSDAGMASLEAQMLQKP